MDSLKICDSSNEKYLLYEFSKKLFQCFGTREATKHHWTKEKFLGNILKIHICGPHIWRL